MVDICIRIVVPNPAIIELTKKPHSILLRNPKPNFLGQLVNRLSAIFRLSVKKNNVAIQLHPRDEIILI